MKKLLILMLVLGMTSAAKAAIILSFDDNTTLTETTLSIGDTAAIGIYNTDGGDYVAYINVSKLSEGGFSMSNPRCPWICIEPFWSEPYEYDDCIEIEVTLAQHQGPSTPGIQFLWDLTCLKVDVDVFVEMWDTADLSAPVDSLIIHQIPEPMTLALLGLGGLLVLRRRK